MKSEIPKAVRDSALKFAMDDPEAFLRIVDKASKQWNDKQLDIFIKGLDRLEKRCKNEKRL